MAEIFGSFIAVALLFIAGIVIPFPIALLVTWGDWKNVLRACAIWAVLTVLITAQLPEHQEGMIFLFVLIYSIPALSIIALMLKFSGILLTLFRTLRNKLTEKE